MRIEGKTIYADEGKQLRRIADKLLRGEELTLGYTYYINDQRLDEPHLEVPEDYEEVSEEDLRQEKLPLYAPLVEKYIRRVYSLSEELAIQRQRDTNEVAFNDYFNYCEYCKRKAKEELGL